MTDLDQLLAGHVRAAAGSAAAPPLAVLRRRAARRRAARVGAALMSVAAVAAVLAVAGVVPGGSATDRARVADGAGGDLESYLPSPGVGALAGIVAEVPIGEQRAVTLRFANASGETREVRTRQGGTWSLELPPGRWTITAVEGGGVCPRAVTVTAGAWQRNDLAWPCSSRKAPVIERSTPQRFDPLVITVVLRSDHVASGGVLRSRKIVENPSDTTVTDPSCDIGAGRYALVPVSEPDAELWVQPVVDCSGAYKMEPGFREESSGPEFPAHTKYGDPLPPGEYLAVLEIEGLSERLEYPVTVE